jgi:hypothetical protein
MVSIRSSSMTDCPNCGREMPMVTWVGEKPRCYRCRNNESWDVWQDDEDEKCLHEALNEKTPPYNNTHNLVCNCPKCTIWC